METWVYCLLWFLCGAVWGMLWMRATYRRVLRKVIRELTRDEVYRILRQNPKIIRPLIRRQGQERERRPHRWR